MWLSAVDGNLRWDLHRTTVRCHHSTVSFLEMQSLIYQRRHSGCADDAVLPRTVGVHCMPIVCEDLTVVI
jgi:hypothetical protein